MDYIPSQYDAAQEEPLFENGHTRGKTFFKEFYSYNFFKRPTMILCFALMTFFFCIGLLYAILLKSPNYLLLLVPVLVVFFEFVLYFGSVNTATKREEENANGTPIVYTTQIYEDRLVCSTSLGSTVTVQYVTIAKVRQSKHYIYLGTKANQLYPIAKDGFTKGSLGEFYAFLKQKGYKVKGK